MPLLTELGFLSETGYIYIAPTALTLIEPTLIQSTFITHLPKQLVPLAKSRKRGTQRPEDGHCFQVPQGRWKLARHEVSGGLDDQFRPERTMDSFRYFPPSHQDEIPFAWVPAPSWLANFHPSLRDFSGRARIPQTRSRPPTASALTGCVPPLRDCPARKVAAT